MIPLAEIMQTLVQEINRPQDIYYSLHDDGLQH